MGGEVVASTTRSKGLEGVLGRRVLGGCPAVPTGSLARRAPTIRPATASGQPPPSAPDRGGPRRRRRSAGDDRCWSGAKMAPNADVTTSNSPSAKGSACEDPRRRFAVVSPLAGVPVATSCWLAPFAEKFESRTGCLAWQPQENREMGTSASTEYCSYQGGRAPRGPMEPAARARAEAVRTPGIQHPGRRGTRAYQPLRACRQAAQARGARDREAGRIALFATGALPSRARW